MLQVYIISDELIVLCFSIIHMSHVLSIENVVLKTKVNYITDYVCMSSRRSNIRNIHNHAYTILHFIQKTER